MNNTIIVRLTGKNGLTQTFRGTIEEIARYFEVKANSENELLRKLSYKFSSNEVVTLNQVVTLAKRISKRNIDVAEELIKREEAKEKARLLEQQKEKEEKKQLLMKKLRSVKNIQAVTEVMPGLYEVKFVISEATEEILDFLRKNKYILKLDYLQAEISNVDEVLSIEKVWYEYEKEPSLKVCQEEIILQNVKVVSEYIYEY